MTTGVVVFVPADFKARYPEFASVSDAVLANIFEEATLYLDNTDKSKVNQIERRKILLWMVTAHLAAMSVGVNGQAPSGVVGRVSQATEGSVTVSLDMGNNQSASAAWWLQTPYGANFWQAMSIYRRARYFPGQSGPAPTIRFGERFGFGRVF